MKDEDPRQNVFDYRFLRLVVGVVALSLPLIVSLLAPEPLESISASYHEGGRDVFVGMLVAVGTLMLAYNGHSRHESQASKTAAVAAILVALFPTTCDTCGVDLKRSATVHFAAAFVLFVILAYFCFGPFREKIKDRRRGTKPRRRSDVYRTCGWLIVLSVLSIGIAWLLLDEATYARLRVTYFGEFTGLVAFGVAWIVAGKAIPLFVDEEERLPLSWR
jgi:quinol-cytochrome oxidoreductase complex cytochrome b subunit